MKDILGNEIKIGDLVITDVTYGRGLTLGRVTAMRVKARIRYDDRAKDAIRGSDRIAVVMGNDFKGGYKQCVRDTLREVENKLIGVSPNAAKEMRELLNHLKDTFRGVS